MSEFVKYIRNHLRELYPNKIYDLDNDISILKNKNWNISSQSRRGDFLIMDSHNILIEIKEIKEDDEDIRIKNELKEMRGTGFYVPDMLPKFKAETSKANRQHKDFIELNASKFNSFDNVSTITAFVCNKISTDFRIPDILELIYGAGHQEVSLAYTSKYYVKNKILHENQYTHTSFIANWIPNEKFIIYSNPYSIYKSDKPIYITPNDTVYIFKHEFVELFQEHGVRVTLFEKNEFNKLPEFIFLVENRWVESKYIEEYMSNKIIEYRKINKEMIIKLMENNAR